MKIWFCAKTDDPLDTVAKVITAFNNVDEQTPKGKWTWSIEKGTGPEEYWKIISKFEVDPKMHLVYIHLVYREGDTVVLGEVPRRSFTQLFSTPFIKVWI